MPNIHKTCKRTSFLRMCVRARHRERKKTLHAARHRCVRFRPGVCSRVFLFFPVHEWPKKRNIKTHFVSAIAHITYSGAELLNTTI